MTLFAGKSPQNRESRAVQVLSPMTNKMICVST